MGVKIILLSCRSEIARRPITNWLFYSRIHYDVLLKRAVGDERKDSVVTNELYEAYVKVYYFIEFILDDPNQVVDLWRLEICLPCLKVNYGNIR
jgi:hypothetical protein